MNKPQWLNAILSFMTEICLFPIPNCVTFPGTVFPLHVFEPRYRKMIQYCLDNHALLGICHTRKTIRAAKANQPLEEALKTNQGTYQPYDVFSAGYCELLETTDDGRMYLNVKIKKRYKAVKEIQTLPFLIYECEEYPDQAIADNELDKTEALKQQLLAELQQRLQSNTELLNSFNKTDWGNKPLEYFSYQIFSFLTFPAQQQQLLLNITSVPERLAYALTLLNTK